ncbi:uncharacterized protein At4g13230 [Punica granatum]|uniref:Uncharacterized protein n=2 Tax=Punica granatum TaxID=22663 RepID=A0A218XM94_PUNGR|nr:uncharacterized protein At4g13230 [Punica granatum]OWM86117.1 hypothetical protein CDL15_Pgr010941 [Punica granatum]PKI53398.1 hypothetical protein CRG98_026187 [Punica granatum]
MASLTLGSAISKSGKFVSMLTRTSAFDRPNLFSASGRRAIQASSHPESSVGAEAVDTIKHGADEAVKAGENIKSRAAHTAQNVTEKAKQTAESAWDTAKDTAQKAKDTVVGKAKDTSDSIRENAAKVERSMNTKN